MENIPMDIEEAIVGLGEFLKRLGFSEAAAERALDEVLGIVAEDFTLRLLTLLPPAEVAGLQAITDNTEMSPQEKCIAIWEKAVPLCGDERATELFNHSLKTVIDSYMASMQQKLS